MTAHSPGPWMANGREVRDAAGRSIAGAHEWDTRPKAPIEAVMQRATVLANARLIAEAPAMLALLRDAGQWYCGEMPDGTDRREAIAALLARIDGAAKEG